MVHGTAVSILHTAITHFPPIILYFFQKHPWFKLQSLVICLCPSELRGIIYLITSNNLACYSTEVVYAQTFTLKWNLIDWLIDFNKHAWFVGAFMKKVFTPRHSLSLLLGPRSNCFVKEKQGCQFSGQSQCSCLGLSSFIPLSHGMACHLRTALHRKVRFFFFFSSSRHPPTN